MEHTRFAYVEARQLYSCDLCEKNIEKGEHYYWIRHKSGSNIDIYHICRNHFGHPNPAEILERLIER
jgi:hypothetical protein